VPNIVASDRAVSLDTLRNDPGRLLLTADLAALGLVVSYDGAARAVKLGRLPKPYRLPNGRPAWEARDVLAALEASRADGGSETPITSPSAEAPGESLSAPVDRFGTAA
jgi:hypothetical protein